MRPLRLLPVLPRRLAPVLLAACVACGGGGGSSPPTHDAPDTAAITAAVSANSTALASIEPSATGFDDLAAFGAAVGDRRIVLLTEPTHGDGATYLLKTRLVRYLHEVKGFDVLFIESGLYDVARMQQRVAAGGDSLSVQAPGRVFYMYSRTDAGQQVLRYVDATRATATPLQLWGHDVPMGGVDSHVNLLPALRAFLDARHSTLPQDVDWPGWLRVATQNVGLQSNPVTSADSTSFLAMSARLTDELCAQPDPGGDVLQSPALWCRLAKGVQADYTHLWSATDIRTPTDLRDVTGAGNIEWLLDGRLQGHKAVVWLHEVHGSDGIARPTSCAAAQSQECGPGWTSVGTELSSHYGDQVYIAKVTAGGGAYDTYNFVSGCGIPTSGFPLEAPTSNMLEYWLATGGQPRFMAYPSDAAARAAIAPLGVYEEELAPHVPSHFGTRYDGVFFLPRLVPTATDCAAYPVIDYP